MLEAQRLDSGSHGLKHNSNKSTAGGMIPESFTPTILPDAYFDILSSSPTINFSYNILIIKCVFQNIMIIKKILMHLHSVDLLFANKQSCCWNVGALKCDTWGYRWNDAIAGNRSPGIGGQVFLLG